MAKTTQPDLELARKHLHIADLYFRDAWQQASERNDLKAYQIATYGDDLVVKLKQALGEAK
jgi:hypothetical protein